MGKSRRFWAVLAGLASAACLVTCVACLVVLGLGDLAYNFLSSEASVGVGQEAPDFELATLSGDVIRLSQFHGQPAVISFGATWCPDCRKEASNLQRLEVKFKSTVNVAEIQKQADQLAQEHRELDARIQEVNWRTELLEWSSVGSRFNRGEHNPPTGISWIW